MKIESSKLSRLLKKVHLGGVISEVVVNLGPNTIQAVDPTNSIFISVSEGSSEDGIGKIGIGDPTLAMLIKHLDTIKGEVAIKKEGKRLVVAALGRGEIKYLTVEEEFISSVVVEEGNIESIVDPCVIFLEITQQTCSDFNSYLSLLNTKSAKFCFNAKTMQVHVESGLESEHQFNIPFGKADFVGEPHKEDFSVIVYGNHINQIFKNLEFPEKVKPQILMGPDHALVVLQDDSNMWACLPLGENAETQS